MPAPDAPSDVVTPDRIDRRLIDKSLLSAEEIAQFDAYHARVLREIGAAEVPQLLVFNKLDMVPADEREARVKDFVKRFRYKGPVFEISALTREGCEPLIKAVYQHIKAQQVAETPHIDVDPRFAGDAAQ